MVSIIESHCLLDGRVTAVEAVRGTLRFRNRSLYEVIRIISGIPLFYEEHIQRMRQSGKIVTVEFPFSESEIYDQIQLLIERCQKRTGNIKLLYGYTSKSDARKFLAAYIPHHYPTNDMYKEGVAATLFRNERSIPNAKLSKERPKALGRLIDGKDGLYEVLMVNSGGYVTEGSRSNLFFVKGNTVVTSPVADVLPGITRKKVLTLLEDNHMKLIQTPIHKDVISEYDALFLTGTSPGVLPVRSVNAIDFDVDHPIVRTLMDQYRELVERYLKTS